MRKKEKNKVKVPRRQDLELFQNLYLKHYQVLCARAFFILKNQKSAEDAVQDLFVKLWRSHVQFDQINSMEAYLNRALRNICLDYLKKDITHQSVSEVEYSIESDTNLFDQVVKKEMLGLMDEVIAELPEQCRVIFTLVYLDGKKYQEAADLAGISVNTVKTQLKRGMEKLREKAKRYY